MSVPPATEMFQFAGFASLPYEFRQGYPLPGGLPHSEIPGSTIARISPGLFAACRVLHRLSVPRHPPDALLSRSITRDARPADHPKITRTASRPPENRRAQGQAPPSLERGATPPAAARMKTLLRTAPRTGSPHRATALQDSKPMPRPVRLGHIHKSASPFNQRQPRNPGCRRGTCPPGRPGTGTKPGLLRASGDLRHPIAGVGASGGERDRTDDLLLAKQALSQLSYTPVTEIRGQNTEIRLIFRSLSSDLCDLAMVGQGGFEPPTSRLSSARSNQLSY
jgi:hypothetical protein